MEKLDSRVLLAASTTVAPVQISDELPQWMLDQYAPVTNNFAHPGAFLTSAQAGSGRDIGVQYLQTASLAAGVNAAATQTPFITASYTDAASNGGLTHTYLQQEFNGLPVLNAVANVSVDARGRVLSASTNFASSLTLENGVGRPALSAVDALRAISDELGIDPTRGIRQLQTTTNLDRVTTLSAPDYQTAPIVAQLSYVAQDKGQMELAWHTIVDLPSGEHWFELGISALTGKVLFATDYVDHASYNVFALPKRSPNDGARTILTDPALPVPSPYGWHDTNGVAGAEYTITRGNNVYAGIDRDGVNGPDASGSPDGGASLTFNQALDLTQAPTVLTNQQAAVTNLFYLNNSIHDITYGYGFNEASGNFQVNNYSRGGAGNDAVSAEAQDSSGTNNANFGTPADGSAPRMQMYLFNSTTPNKDGDLDAEVVIHEYTHGIGNRLTGGPANVSALNSTQSGGMGEGWGDWLGLMMTMKATDTATTSRPVGTYVLGQPSTGAGIRRQPYNTNMAVNNQTIALYNSSSEVHNAGELWVDALWDMSWNLIGRYGFSSDLQGGWSPGQAGNKLAIQLVLNGMKLQPANPRFSDARDAILQADVNLTGGANSDLIWQAFARRGMGFSFNSGTNANATSVVAAFDVPAQIAGTLFDDTNDNGTADAGEIALSGATVFLDGNNNGVLDSGETSTVTTSNGNYAFSNLPNATYTVRAFKAGAHVTSPAAAAYTVTVASLNAINTGRNFTLSSKMRISGVAYDDANANGVRDTGEAGIQGARLYIDTNQNGVYDGAVLDATNSTPASLPDLTTVNSTITVSGVAGTVSALGVRLNITHTYNGDLDIFLVSPSGTRIELSTDNGASADGLDVTLLDSATQSVTAWPTVSGVGPTTGTWKPEGLLSAVNGQAFNGVWRLEITDDASGDVGTLNSWSIFQGSSEPSTLTAADGSYLLNNLTPAGGTIAQVAIAGRVATSPPNGRYDFSLISGVTPVYTVDFGSTAAALTFNGTAGDDTYYVRSSGDNSRVQIYTSNNAGAEPVFDVSRASIGSTGLIINTGEGNDTVFFDYTNGDPAATNGIRLELGGGAADRVNVIGRATAETFVFSSDSIASNVIVHGHESIGFDGKLGGDSLTINSGPAVTLLASQKLSSLSLSSGTTFDVATYGVVLTQATQYAALRNIIAGLTTNAGTISSSYVAANTVSRGLAIAPVSQLSPTSGTLLGVSYDASSLLIRPTLKGDANLDGSVNFSDLIILAAHYNTASDRNWAFGDFDYSGMVDFADLVSLSANYNTASLRPVPTTGRGSTDATDGKTRIIDGLFA